MDANSAIAFMQVARPRMGRRASRTTVRRAFGCRKLGGSIQAAAVRWRLQRRPLRRPVRRALRAAAAVAVAAPGEASAAAKGRMTSRAAICAAAATRRTRRTRGAARAGRVAGAGLSTRTRWQQRRARWVVGAAHGGVAAEARAASEVGTAAVGSVAAGVSPDSSQQYTTCECIICDAPVRWITRCAIMQAHKYTRTTEHTHACTHTHTHTRTHTMTISCQRLPACQSDAVVEVLLTRPTRRRNLYTQGEVKFKLCAGVCS